MSRPTAPEARSGRCPGPAVRAGRVGQGPTAHPAPNALAERTRRRDPAHPAELNGRAEPRHGAEPGCRRSPAGRAEARQAELNDPSEPNHRAQLAHQAAPSDQEGLNGPAAPRGRPEPTGCPGWPAQGRPDGPKRQQTPRGPSWARHRDRVPGLRRGCGGRTGPAPGRARGLRRGCPARGPRPGPGPGSRCGRGTPPGPALRRFPGPPGLPRPGRLPRGPDGQHAVPGARRPAPARRSRHPGQHGARPRQPGQPENHGRGRSHVLRWARPGGRRPAQRQAQARPDPDGCHRACARDPAQAVPGHAQVPAQAQRVPARRARALGPDRNRPNPARALPGSHGWPHPGHSHLGHSPVCGHVLPHPGRQNGRSRPPNPGPEGAGNRAPHWGEPDGRTQSRRPAPRGVRSPGSRCPPNRHARNRAPHLLACRTSHGRVTTRRSGPLACSRVRTPPRMAGDHSRAPAQQQAQTARAVSLRRRSPGCLVAPGTRGIPADLPGPPACAAPAPYRGTAAADNHAAAGHRGTRDQDRRTHAHAARAAVPAGPGRSYVPLPCQ